MIKGVLFDVDGTLLLSNDAHAKSWVEAFAEYGYTVEYDKVRRLIGMGADKLIAAVQPGLTESAGDGQKIKQIRSEIFLNKYAPSLNPAPGSRELVAAVQGMGLRTMVASSAKKDELKALLKAAKVDDLLTQATTSDDADGSKPDPDIVLVALQKIGLMADEVVMIGDTPYDIAAANQAGVGCLAVRCGGWQDQDLQGAVGVYDNPQDILRNREEIWLF